MEPKTSMASVARDIFPTRGPHCRQTASQTSFVMLLGTFLDVFWAYVEDFGLDFGIFDLQKMPKKC